VRTPLTLGTRALPRGLATGLRKSRARLALLDRPAVVTSVKAEGLALEAIALQRDLRAMAELTIGSQRKAIEAMIDHAHALEKRYIRASAPDER
jgi:hypothetical protein